jgi:hypothetical protein
MVTNKLNNYIGFLAFVVFWLIFIFSKLLEWNALISIPLLATCMLIQITALWMPDAIYIPIKFLGMTSEKLFLEKIKEGDEFITDFGVRYIVILKKENLIALGCSAESVTLPIDKFVPFLKDNGVSKYNNKPIKFDPLWK